MKIKNLSTSGGLFKTTSVNTLLQSAESSGWFKFISQCDDARVCELINQEKSHEIKLRLTKEVLEQISLFKSGINLNDFESRKPLKNGLETARESNKDCKTAYCKAQNIFLDVGNSVFGESNQVDQFISKNNHLIVEEVIENRPVTFTGIMGFGE